jgi:hypothetical protein
MQYHYSNGKLEIARGRANSSNSQDDDIISRLLEETPSTSSQKKRKLTYASELWDCLHAIEKQS